ncbi:unnamed protein product [Microthlaspi erraticum]|uniref:Uncharacterized protein n=1 Tax=Microthlaspi erraticum TaxID=1685480 RepID=A0A6D2KEY1_9BRAS|nr:unnamed protein product [Microthlaspi erraticum]
MSLLLNQPSKLCFRKPVLVRSSPLHSDGFSSSSLAPQTLPYAIICADPCRPNLVTVVSNRDGDLSPSERKMPMDLVESMGMIGTSNGWIAKMNKGVVRLENTRLHRSGVVI